MFGLLDCACHIMLLEVDLQSLTSAAATHLLAAVCFKGDGFAGFDRYICFPFGTGIGV